jgi:hypothetical protein
VGGSGGSFNFHVEDAPDNCNSGATCPNVATSLLVPENIIFFIGLVPFVPMMGKWLRKRKREMASFPGF